jgi:DNA-binding NarL/FixJ family response regulator
VSPPEQIRVIVGEDQPFVREGVVRVLQDGGFDVVAAAADARDLIQMARTS